ncbi:MAG: MarR family transcriptional regulator [Coriobacteriales bacterium]|nr:MarR family transcriptional regulator [Coriobacteriales bacterium]
MDLLQHQKASFLRRSFQHIMEPLAQSEVEVAMRKTIEASGRTIGKEALADAASSTEGFPFLIQLNGYHIWRQSPQNKRVSKQDVVDGVALAKADMDRMILTTTIGELSRRDLDFLVAMAQEGSDIRIGRVAERMGTSPSQASKHKKRLLALGLIEEKPFGVLGFQLPLLREYLIDHYSE